MGSCKPQKESLKAPGDGREQRGKREEKKKSLIRGQAEETFMTKGKRVVV